MKSSILAVLGITTALVVAGCQPRPPRHQHPHQRRPRRPSPRHKHPLLLPAAAGGAAVTTYEGHDVLLSAAGRGE